MKDIVITEVLFAGKPFLKIKDESKPLVFKPKFDEGKDLEMENGFYEIEYPRLDIYVAGYTRESLINELFETLLYSWKEYAMADDKRLTESARKLKRKMLATFERVK